MQGESSEQKRIGEIEAEINRCGSTTGKSDEVQRLARALNEKNKVLVDVLKDECERLEHEILDLVMGSLEGLKSFDDRPIQAFWCQDYAHWGVDAEYIESQAELKEAIARNNNIPNSTIVLAVSVNSTRDMLTQGAHVEAVKIDIGSNGRAEKITHIINGPYAETTSEKIREKAKEQFTSVYFKFLFSSTCTLGLDPATMNYEVVVPCCSFTSYKCGQTTLTNVLTHVLGGDEGLNLEDVSPKLVARYYLDLAEILLVAQEAHQVISKIVLKLQGNRQEAVKSEVAEEFQQIKNRHRGLIEELERKHKNGAQGLAKLTLENLRVYIKNTAKEENKNDIEDDHEIAYRVKADTKYGRLFAAIRELEVKERAEMSFRAAKAFIMQNSQVYLEARTAIENLQAKVQTVANNYKARYQPPAAQSTTQRRHASTSVTSQPVAHRSAASTPSTSTGRGQQPNPTSFNLAAPSPEADIKEHIEYIGKQQNLSEATIKFAQQISQDKRLTDFEGKKEGEVKTDAYLLHIAEGLNKLDAIKKENITFINYSIDCSLDDIDHDFVFNVMMHQDGKDFFKEAIQGSKLCMFYTSALGSFNTPADRAAGVAYTIAVVFRVNEQKKIEITYCEAPRDTAMTSEERQAREKERLPMFLKPEFYQQAITNYKFVEIDHSQTKTVQPYQFGINMGCVHTTVICGLMNALGDDFSIDKSQRPNAEEAKHFLDIATLELGTEAQKEALVGCYISSKRGTKRAAKVSSGEELSQQPSTTPISSDKKGKLDPSPSQLGVDSSKAGTSSSGAQPMGQTGIADTKLDISAGAFWRKNGNIATIRTRLANIRKCHSNEAERKGKLLKAIGEQNLGMPWLSDDQTMTLALQAVAVNDFEQTLKCFKEESCNNYRELEEGLKKYYPELPANLNDKLKDIYKKLKERSEAIIADEINGSANITLQVKCIIEQVIMGKTPEPIGNTPAYRIYPLLDDLNFIPEPTAPPLDDGGNTPSSLPYQSDPSSMAGDNTPLDISLRAHWRNNISGITTHLNLYGMALQPAKATWVNKLRENLDATGSDEHIITLAKQALAINAFEEIIRICRPASGTGTAYPADNVLNEGLKKYCTGPWILPRAELIGIYNSLRDNKQAIIEAEINGTKTIKQHIEELVKEAQERIKKPDVSHNEPRPMTFKGPTINSSGANPGSQGKKDDPIAPIKIDEKLKSHKHKAFKGNPIVWIHSASLALAIGCGAIGAYLLATDRNPGLSKKLAGIGLMVLATIMGLVSVKGLIVNKVNNAKSSDPSTEIKDPVADSKQRTQVGN